jgi:hypothetical protein
LKREALLRPACSCSLTKIARPIERRINGFDFFGFGEESGLWAIIVAWHNISQASSGIKSGWISTPASRSATTPLNIFLVMVVTEFCHIAFGKLPAALKDIWDKRVQRADHHQGPLGKIFEMQNSHFSLLLSAGSSFKLLLLRNSIFFDAYEF